MNTVKETSNALIDVLEKATVPKGLVALITILSAGMLDEVGYYKDTSLAKQNEKTRQKQIDNINEWIDKANRSISCLEIEKEAYIRLRDGLLEEQVRARKERSS